MTENIPDWHGPLPHEYGAPHVYARDVHSEAGYCVCGGVPGDERHTQIAPGVDVPLWMREGGSPDCALCKGPCVLDFDPNPYGWRAAPGLISGPLP